MAALYSHHERHAADTTICHTTFAAKPPPREICPSDALSRTTCERSRARSAALVAPASPTPPARPVPRRASLCINTAQHFFARPVASIPDRSWRG